MRFQLPKSLRSQDHAAEPSKSKDVEQTPSADNAKMQRAKALEAHNIESGKMSGKVRGKRWDVENGRADWRQLLVVYFMRMAECKRC